VCNTQSADVDPDGADTAEGVELPGADLSGEELTMPVIPKQVDEFTRVSSFPGPAPQSRRLHCWGTR